MTRGTVNSGADSKEGAEGDFHFLNSTFLSCTFQQQANAMFIIIKNNKGFKHHLNSGAREL